AAVICWWFHIEYPPAARDTSTITATTARATARPLGRRTVLDFTRRPAAVNRPATCEARFFATAAESEPFDAPLLERESAEVSLPEPSVSDTSACEPERAAVPRSGVALEASSTCVAVGSEPGLSGDAAFAPDDAASVADAAAVATRSDSSAAEPL